MYKACESGDVALVKSLLTSGLGDIDQRDETTGRTSLHAACEKQSLELVKLLLSHKADPSLVDQYLDSPLHVLVKQNPVTMRTVMIADVLVKTHKVDIGYTNSDKQTVADLVKARPNWDSDSACKEVLKIFQPETVTSRSPSMSPVQSPKNLERSESLKKLLSARLPDLKPVPYRQPRRPVTPPKAVLPQDAPPSDYGELRRENEKLMAENAALKDELKKYRDIVSKQDPRMQLKGLYARLIQLEAIEAALNDPVFDDLQ